MSEVMKKPVLQILAELVLVAAGVYMGLLANNWNEERRRADNKREFLTNLALEIKANKASLRQSLTYRTAILAASNKLNQGLDPKTRSTRFWTMGGFNLIPGWRGVQNPALENSVYQAGVISSALSELDFKTLNAVAQVYSFQEEYKMWVRLLVIEQTTTIGDAATTSEVLGRLQWWHDVIGLEKELIRKYDGALAQLQGRKK